MDEDDWDDEEEGVDWEGMGGCRWRYCWNAVEFRQRDVDYLQEKSPSMKDGLSGHMLVSHC